MARCPRSPRARASRRPRSRATLGGVERGLGQVQLAVLPPPIRRRRKPHRLAVHVACRHREAVFARELVDALAGDPPTTCEISLGGEAAEPLDAIPCLRGTRV